MESNRTEGSRGRGKEKVGCGINTTDFFSILSFSRFS